MKPRRPTRARPRTLPGPEWRTLLDPILAAASDPERIQTDPVRFPRARHRAGAGRRDVESVALLSAMLAYGRVSLFLPVIGRILDGCPPPYPAGFLRPRAGFVWPAYRLSTAEDLRRFTGAIARVSAKQGGLWEAFRPGWEERHSVWDGLRTLHGRLLEAAGTPVRRGLRHLLPDPAAGSCSKRWMLFLRWMARPEDGLDLGVWPAPPPSALILPLDRHLGRFARRWGWTRRAGDNRAAAEEITEALRRICPEDPLRYDFAISHLGIDGLCSHGRRSEDCRACGLRKVCRPGRRP